MRLQFWRRKTVAEHLAPITKIVNGLHDHAEYHGDKKAEHEDKATSHAFQANASQVEINLALAQANKIAGLI